MVLLFLLLLFLLLTLLLFLPLALLDRIYRTIGNQLAILADARPFGLSIVDIKDAARVEHMASDYTRGPLAYFEKILQRQGYGCIQQYGRNRQ